MKEKLDICCYIGRFQPFHNGHYATLQKALQLATNVIILLGSASSPRTVKNPWSYKDRIEMISQSLTKDEQARVYFIPIEDYLYSESDWVTSVQRNVTALAEKIYDKPASKINISVIAHTKETSTATYLDALGWPKIPMHKINIDDGDTLNATKIRELIFNDCLGMIKTVVHPHVYTYIKYYVKTDNFKSLVKEYNDAISYECKFNSYPAGYALNFVTVDCVVIQSGKVLLVKRGVSPGLGLYALPGGHVNSNETVKDAAVRELYEETDIDVPEKVLRGSIIAERVFDHPERSLRGRVTKTNARTITHAFGIKLDDSRPLPNVTRGDDAAGAWWFTFDEIEKMRGALIEDHWDIINYVKHRL